MNGFDVIIEKVAFIGIMILIGFLCEKTGYVKNITDGLSKIIKNITLPIMIIVSVSGNVLSSEAARDGLLIFVLAVLVIVFMVAVGSFTSRVFKLDAKKRGIQICMGSFGNVAFLGFPLLKALLGDEGILYAVFYSLANDGLLWSLGLGAISGEKGVKKLKNMLNVCTLSYVIGILMMVFGITLPGVVKDAAESIGSATTPLSMLFIGATIARADILSALRSVPVYILMFTKMVLVPCILIFLLAMLPAGFMGLTAMTVLVLQAAMPSQTLFAILANEYRLDEKYAVEVICVTTIFSLISLPPIYKLVTIILG